MNASKPPKRDRLRDAIDEYDMKIYAKEIEPFIALQETLVLLKKQKLNMQFSLGNYGFHYDYIIYLCECRRRLQSGQHGAAYRSLRSLAHHYPILQERILSATIALLEEYV